MSRERQLVFSSPIAFLAFGLGSGLSPKAPGTAGTLAAMPFLFLFQPWLNTWWFGGFLALAFLAGIFICGRTSDALGVHDHGGIVWDEFVGLWLTFWFIPLTPMNLILGFCLFRFFDILKPFPIKWLDSKVSGGLGIMIDDLVAGFISLVLMTLIQLFN